MALKLLVGIAIVAHISVICTANSYAFSSSVANAKSQGSSSYSSAQSSSISQSRSRSKKCRKVKRCPKNEEFSYCPKSIGRIQYCSEKFEVFRYPKSDETPCKQGCVCKENYLRTKNGTCIPAEECEITCRAHEVVDNCPSECDTDFCPKEEYTDICDTPEECLPPACKCEFNYRRNDFGDCIPTRDCPPFDCSERPNEEYDPCPPICPSDDCSQASPTGECPKQFGRIGIVLPCNPRCRCIKDYWRLNETCVPYGQCPGVCPANERYSTCIQGECRALNCTQINQSVPCVRIDPNYCVKGCVCVEGYLRAEDGTCVPESECETICPSNEELSECSQIICRAQNCTQIGQPIACPSIAEGSCIKACVCKENYLRDENGDCIPQDQCPPICSPNEERSECSQAICRAQNCTQIGQPIACPSIAEGSCIEACVCKENYLRDGNGDCIPQDQCPPICSPNEERSECAQAICRAQNCSEIGQPIACPLIAEGSCIEACVCKENYLRDENGDCIPEDQCPPICSPNEERSECAQAICRAQNCTQIGQPIACPMIAEGSCIEACVCKENYLRDENGDCIPEDQCPPICSPNEERSECAQAICRAQNCTQIGQPIACPSIAEGSCIKACVCKENYLRDENGDCIPEDQCPPICPSNEEWSECSQIICREQSCTQIGQPIACPSIAEGSCIKACVCKETYLRDENGDCIPEDQCPPICPPNEERSECSQAICRAQNCTQIGQPIACPSIAEGSCIEACVCKESYLRDENGDCIPEDQCPPTIICGENEVIDTGCPSICTSDYCPKWADEKQSCVETYPCKPTCKCHFNYRRADNGTCIPTRNCPPFDCSKLPNEEYDPCPAYCPTDDCSLARVKGRCPYRIGIVLECNPKCQCQEGYGRVDGICVPFSKCPNLCPLNEEYSSCIQATCRPQLCEDRDADITECPAVEASSCERGCVCQEGYYRNDEGDCISYEQCGGPLCPWPNEHYSKAVKRCPPNICSSLVSRYICDEPQIEEPGCPCDSGYLRPNLTAHCVPICDCPEMAGSPDC